MNSCKTMEACIKISGMPKITGVEIQQEIMADKIVLVVVETGIMLLPDEMVREETIVYKEVETEMETETRDLFVETKITDADLIHKQLVERK